MNGINNTSNNWQLNSYSNKSIGFYGNLSQMNDSKLSQIMAIKGTTGGKSSSLSSNTANFLKEYQSKMSAMMTEANSLRSMSTTGDFNNLSASSSDTKVLEADAYYRLTDAATYNVDVKQLATAQTNSSTGVASGEAGALSGQLTIVTNNKTVTINTDSLSGKTNEEQLKSLATEVNRYKMGVSAKVVTKDGKASLEITGTQTGKNNGFVVSGGFAEKSGLNTASKLGQDAVYSVNDQEFTSSSNTVNVGSYKVFATLKETGKATVTVGADVEKTTAKVQDLVDSFNSTLKLLNDNSSRGMGVLKQTKRMVSPPASVDSLKLAGITINKDGSLKLNQAEFKDAMNKNPSLIKDIISGSHGLAEGVYSDARAGLQASSASLVSSDLAKAQQQQTGFPQAGAQGGISDSAREQFAMMSTYNKSGVYNMLNFYAVGSMMNFSV